MTTEAHLVATCRNCGAAQPLTLSAPVSACPHCGDEDPLEANVRSRLDEVRAQLAKRDAASRQLTTRALVEGDALHGAGLITIVICWLLFGGVAVYISFEHNVATAEFLRGGKPATQWWLLWSFAFGLPLSFALLEASVARVRSLGYEALPAPPATDGAQPRCRYCAAELPAGTALRRCSSCQADNLVISGRYLRAQTNLDRALDDIVSRFDRDLQKRIDAGGGMAMTGGVAPFFLLFIGPIAGHFTPGNATLWLVPGATAVIALALAGYARLRRLPVEPVELLGLGDKVHVRGHDNPGRQVSAQLMLDSGPISLLKTQKDEPRLAVATSRSDGALTTTVYKVKPGNQPVDDVRDQLIAAELWHYRRNEPAEIEPVRVLLRDRSWHLFRGDEPTAFLQGNPSGKPPLIVVV